MAYGSDELGAIQPALLFSASCLSFFFIHDTPFFLLLFRYDDDETGIPLFSALHSPGHGF